MDAGKKVGVAILNLLKLMDISLINIIGYTDSLATMLAKGIRQTFNDQALEKTRDLNIRSKGYDPFMGIRGAAEVLFSTFLNSCCADSKYFKVDGEVEKS